MTRACSLLVGITLLVAGCGSGESADSGSSAGSAVELTVVGPDGSEVTFSPPIDSSVSATAVPGGTEPAGVGTPTTRPGGTVPGATAAGATVPGATTPGGSTPGGTTPGVTATTTTTIVGGTTPVTTVAPPAVATTLTATTVATTAAPTTVAVTAPPSTEGAPVCDLALVIQQTETTFEGITPDSLLCAATWASWSGIPDDPLTTDGYFAVAQWNGVAWQLRNLGTAGVCAGGAVPADLWPALGCFE